jgi:LssY C-terminus
MHGKVPTTRQAHRRRRLRSVSVALVLLAALYVAIAYALLPVLWSRWYSAQPSVSTYMLTVTPQGIPGDPINIGLVGSKADVLQAFAAAKWDPADAITLRSSIEIGASVILDRPYPDAPVSILLYDGRHQDLAFEKPVGESADQRHHIRLWMTANEEGGRPMWLGSASFDRGVGLSHDTGQITHHIGPDVDAERDTVIEDLSAANVLAREYQIPGRGPTTDGRNGGGDRYFTDGMVTVGIISP